MVQSSATATQNQIGTMQTVDCRVGSDVPGTSIRSKYKAVRSTTSAIAASLSAEDQMVQSSPDASPVKWHRAHTTWFFETFVLRPLLKDYKPFRELEGFSTTLVLRSQGHGKTIAIGTL